MTTQKTFTKEQFKTFATNAFQMLKTGEIVTFSLSAENTLFTRLSKAKIRQSSYVDQGSVSMNLIADGKTINMSFNYTQDLNNDLLTFRSYLDKARSYLPGLNTDPYQVVPTNNGESVLEAIHGELPSDEEIIALALDHVGDYDLAGVLTKGDMIRANANSLGQFHWFKTRSFYVDYSFYNEKQKAVKGLYAGSVWNQQDYTRELKDSIDKLNMMSKESVEVPRGDYRVYLAPSAVNEILGILSWGGVSAGAHKRGEGSLNQLMKGEKKLSPKFTLEEDFNLGLAPRFNDLGEVSPLSLTLIKNGEYKEFLTSTRTAKEFNLNSNFASEYEGLRSPKIHGGELKREDILKKLDRGLYISDLHYLNWSDRETARITGMTRYACFWVENGEIVAPIKDLRFDESIYKIFGSGLVEFTEATSIVPATGSYGGRDIGGTSVPGALIEGFTFTL